MDLQHLRYQLRSGHYYLYDMRDALNAIIELVTVTKTSAAWIKLFNDIGLPSGPIYNIDQVFADEQVKHLGIAQDAISPNGETRTFVGQPFGLSRTPSRISSDPVSDLYWRVSTPSLSRTAGG